MLSYRGIGLRVHRIKSSAGSSHLDSTNLTRNPAKSFINQKVMRGYLRLCLATLVALSHTGYSNTINIGFPAVIVFYMLAGYVVTHLLHKHFPPKHLSKFYIDRILRIFPLYLFFLLPVALFLYLTNFRDAKFTPFSIFANLTIIPLNYFMYLKVHVIPAYSVLPPAWSLGLELQAYAILPLIIRSLPAKWIVGFVSLFIFSISAFRIIDEGFWGYTLIPGVMYVFLTGSAICKNMKFKDIADPFDRTFPTICWSWLLLLLIGLYISHNLHAISTATILGFLIGMPIVQYISSSSIRLPFDNIMGQISYGVFLIHMPVAWMFEFLVKRSPVGMSDFTVIMIISTIVSAGCTLPIDHFMWPLRKSFTKVQ